MKTLTLDAPQIDLIEEVLNAPGFALGPKHWDAAARLRASIQTLRASESLPPSPTEGK